MGKDLWEIFVWPEAFYRNYLSWREGGKILLQLKWERRDSQGWLPAVKATQKTAACLPSGRLSKQEKWARELLWWCRERKLLLYWKWSALPKCMWAKSTHVFLVDQMRPYTRTNQNSWRGLPAEKTIWQATRTPTDRIWVDETSETLKLRGATENRPQARQSNSHIRGSTITHTQWGPLGTHSSTLSRVVFKQLPSPQS